MYPIILALLSALLFGASTPIGKVLLESLPPFQLAGLMYLGAAVGTAPGFLLQSKKGHTLSRMGRMNLLRLTGAIAFGGVVGPVLLLMGLQRSSAASVSMWLNLELVATAVLGYLFFRDHLGAKGWVGVAGAILASVMISWQGSQVGWIALLLVGCACVCWGLDNHWTALIDGITPQQSTFWKGLFAGTVNLTIGLRLGGPALDLSVTAMALLVGVFAYGISISFYIKAAQQLGATRSQMIFSSAPFFGVVLAVLILNERITLIQTVAALILIAALLILFHDQHAHAHTHKPMRHRHDHNHQDMHHGHTHAQSGIDSHAHEHHHQPIVHAHPHWPDIHHRHKH
jgi:drug/metabolite transporter (DMT)-like permease